jgi:octaprenyl-diphosphate synthase
MVFHKESKSIKSGFKNMADILSQFDIEFNRIADAMTRHFQSHLPLVNDICGHILFAGGKRIRPLLTVLFGRLCGLDTQELYDLSVTPEYLHAASLLHDDVIDGGEFRRGKPAAYRIWGNKATILAGDFLYARAIHLASSFGRVTIAQAISETVARMAEGEILQLQRIGNTSFDEDAYLQIVEYKTASLIAASCKIGALLADAASTQVAAARNYGHFLGIAFQIIDDALDYTADPKEAGKGIGTDLSEGKLTLPLAAALQMANADDKTWLISTLAQKDLSTDSLLRIQKIIQESGALAYTMNKAHEFIQKAVEGLGIFEDSPIRQQLTHIANFVAERKR